MLNHKICAPPHGVIPDARVTLDEVIAEGDPVAVRATWRGTHVGPFKGSPPPGKPVTITGMVFWRVADGKLDERWANLDLSPLRHNSALVRPIPRVFFLNLAAFDLREKTRSATP